MKFGQTEPDLSLDEEIFNVYPADVLDDIFRLHFIHFLKKSVQYFEDWNLDIRDYEVLSIRKRDIIKVLAITFSDEKLFIAWFNQLPYMVSRVFESVTWEGRQPIETLNERAKGRILLESDIETIDRERLNPDFCLFLLSVHHQQHTEDKTIVFLDLPKGVKRKCRRFLPKPKGYFLKPLKIAEETHFVFKDQNRILRVVPTVMEYISQGSLETTKNGLIKKTSINRLRQLTELEEFFPGETRTTGLRNEFIAYMFFEYGNDLISDSSPESLKQLLVRFEASSDLISSRFIEHIKGWYHASGDLNEAFQHNFVQLLKELPPEKWISMNQLNRFIQVRDLELNPVQPSASKYLFLFSEWKGWGNKKIKISYNQFMDLLDKPILYLNLFIMASLGILDLKYNQDEYGIYDQQPDFWFNGLQYIRLTRLGEFLLGLSNSFEPSDGLEDLCKISLDQDRLILSLSKSDSRSEMILGEISERIGRLRYKFDFEHFLKGCETVDRLNNRIGRFLSLISENLPDNWNCFIEDLKSRSHSLIAVQEVEVYRIEKADKDLIDLITSDEELRNLVLLAEDYHIVVKKRDITQLRKRLTIFGYLF